MPVITVFNGTYCNEELVLQALQKNTRYELISDQELISQASQIASIPKTKIDRAFSARPSVFNKITHEKERAIAYLKLAIARLQSKDNIIFNGFTSHLIPRNLNHILRVCLIADMKSRLSIAAQTLNVTEQEASKLIYKQEEDHVAWVQSILNEKDPWHASLYDMVFPTDKVTIETIVNTIMKNTTVVQRDKRSEKAAQNFLLAAEVEVALLQQGHHVTVEADDGHICLTINKHVLMLHWLENELKTIALNVPGVHKVTTKVGAEFHQIDIYRRQDFTMPSKILLVDDEREFVQTLSERLLMRDMGSAVAYDGESALEIVREDEPDVMILDLKMPGIDGIEVLRRVKASQPEIEVIILTGHGSEADKEVCMQLGAFAYLQKPVDVEKLGITIQHANEKIKKNRETNRR